MITSTAIGRATAEPTLSYTKTGAQPVANFTIASDNRDKTTTFLRVTVWGKLAEVVSEHLAKGQQVAASGRLEASEYADRETGEKRTGWTLTADQVEFLAKPRGSTAAAPVDDGQSF
jgi:single-strand DNA-binding protein